MKTQLRALVLASFTLLAVCIQPLHAVFIGNSQGGTDFPEGTASFADQLVDYSPVVLNGQPTPANSEPTKAIGVPDYSTGGGCMTVASCAFVSLGDGGSLTVRFTDNLLTGSGTSSFDLWIFEVGPDVEDTFVEISRNGTTWNAVGKVFGSTAGIDLDAFGFGAGDSFAYVRLTDDPNEGDQVGISVGADIDAIGAISTRLVPEPATWAIVLGAVLVIWWRMPNGGQT